MSDLHNRIAARLLPDADGWSYYDDNPSAMRDDLRAVLAETAQPEADAVERAARAHLEALLGAPVTDAEWAATRSTVEVAAMRAALAAAQPVEPEAVIAARLAAEAEATEALPVAEGDYKRHHSEE